MIGIIDYGLGNLRSVAGAVAKVGFKPLITSKAVALQKADKLILPGVGAFGDGMRNLRERSLINPLTRIVKEGRKPILGICLGAQLLAKESEEFGHHHGLGWVDASVVKIKTDGKLRVPHVGWNDLIQMQPCLLFEGIAKDALFYYVHSFYIQCRQPEIVVGGCEYGVKFAAVIKQENIYATQFHPEKSQLHGLQLLKNFLTLC